MSIDVMRYVWTNSASKGNTRLILLAIADNANDPGDAFPGMDKLSKKGNMSLRTAQDCVQELERMGELQVFEQVGTKTASGWTNLYRVVLDGVKQPEVRTPSGEIATPRPVTDKKSRSFPKGVQTVAPLSDSQAVQTDSPLKNEGVQTVAPDGVQTVAPKPSVQPPVLNTNTKDSDSGNVIHDVVEQALEHLNQVAPLTDNQAIPLLIDAYLKKTGVIAPTMYEKKPIREQARIMHQRGITAADITAYLVYMAKDQFWGSQTIKWEKVCQDISGFVSKRSTPPTSTNPAHQRVVIEEESVTTPEQKEMIRATMKATQEKLLVSNRATNGR